MQTFDILAPESTIVTQIIDLTYTSGKTTPNGDFLIPDGMIYSETPYCQFAGDTFSSSSTEHFKEAYGSKNGIGFAFQAFGFSYSKEV